MNDVKRICPECQSAGSLNARYCAACGYDFQGALPVAQNNLPMVLGKAALPVLVGAASIALRLGWKVLQSRWAQAAAEKAVDAAITRIQENATATPQVVTPSKTQPDVTAARTRRTVTIRSAWSVGDSNGVWRQGFTEHHIDMDE